MAGADGRPNTPSEEGFAAASGIMHELEKAEIDRQLLLRDAPVWSQPRAQQGPQALQGVDVHLAEPVAILVSGIFASCMTHGPVPVTPGLQASIDVVLVR